MINSNATQDINDYIARQEDIQKQGDKLLSFIFGKQEGLN